MGKIANGISFRLVPRQKAQGRRSVSKRTKVNRKPRSEDGDALAAKASPKVRMSAAPKEADIPT